MDKFKVNLPVSSYAIKDNKIEEFGEITVQINDCFYPSKTWTDFGMVIVFGWLQSVSDLLSEKANKVQCKFMDGNYRFDVEKTDAINVWNVYFIREHFDSDETEHNFVVNVEQFTHELLDTIEKIKDLAKLTKNDEGVERIEKLVFEFRSFKNKYFGE